MVLFLDFRRKPLLLLFFDPTALGGYISEDEEKAEAEAEAEEDIEIDYSRLSFQGCEEEKSLLMLVFFFLFSSGVWTNKQSTFFFRATTLSTTTTAMITSGVRLKSHACCDVSFFKFVLKRGGKRGGRRM